MPTIDIDSDAAHDAAQRELQKPIYPKPTLTERLIEWINELLYRLADAGSRIPGGWFTLSVLLIILVVAVIVAIRIARRTMRTNRGGRYALFGENELSAAQHRATAEQYAATGNWAAAIRHRLRAVARELEDCGVLDAIPGRTATELARDAGKALPALAAELDPGRKLFQRRHLRRTTRDGIRLPDDRRSRRSSAVQHSDGRRYRPRRRDTDRLGGGQMTPPLKANERQSDSAVGPTFTQRWSAARWVLLSLVVIIAIATLTTYLTAPRLGGPMDPGSTTRDGTHALVALLREHGVEVVEAPDIAAAERAARPGTLIAVLQTLQLLDKDVLRRLGDLPGDRLLVAPTSSTREALAPHVSVAGSVPFGGSEPGCDLREAKRAGEVRSV